MTISAFERLLRERGLAHVLELLQLGREHPEIVMSAPVVNQVAFRGRNDDGSETSATWEAAENTNWTQVTDVVFRVRFQIEETNNVASSGAIPIQYNLNGAGWVTATPTGTVVKNIASAFVADGTATTHQLTVSLKAFLAGIFDSNGSVSSPAIKNQCTEMEYSVEIVGSGVNNADTIQFRVSGLASYVQTPSVTVSKAAVVVASTPPRVVGQAVMRTATRAVGYLRRWKRGSDGVLFPEVA